MIPITDCYGKPKPNSHSELSLLEALSLHRVRSEAVKTRVVTVNEYEAGRRTPKPNNLAALRRGIEAEGIMLLFAEDGAAAGIIRQGVRINLSNSSSVERP